MKDKNYPYYAIEYKQGHISGWYIVKVLSEGFVSSSIDRILYPDKDTAIIAAQNAGITIRKTGTLYEII
jgi:hypothetical protein